MPKGQISDIRSITCELDTRLPYTLPDPLLYTSIKNISLVNYPVTKPTQTKIPFPDKLIPNADQMLRNSWKKQHGALVEMAFNIDNYQKNIYRTIFPGPYIPSLHSEMVYTGSFAYEIFLEIIKNVKQRIPDINLLKLQNGSFIYQSKYKPITQSIGFPEEGWNYKNIQCPEIEGISFPIPDKLNFTKLDNARLNSALELLNKEAADFLKKYYSSNKQDRIKHIRRIFGLIRSYEDLCDVEISSIKCNVIDTILLECQRQGLLLNPSNCLYALFEIDHAVSYILKIGDKCLVCQGFLGMAWVDVFKLKLEDLVETEFCEISRVLREIRTLFAVGWAPILVYIDKDKVTGFNIDGTHRHYAMLVVELLRRILLSGVNTIRDIDLNSSEITQIINSFASRYQKYGLSLRETLRVLNYLVNSETPWPYLELIETNIRDMINLELKYVPVIYLPEWRARTVVKNMCDNGEGLVGVPPINIEIVGRSKGNKGIFIRGGYHGSDRQPMIWINYLKIQ